MMRITTQIKTIIFSLIFGVLFSKLIEINYKYLTKNKITNILITFIFIITCILIYFILLKKINNGIFHPYEILSIIIGFIIQNITKSRVEKKQKK